MIFGFTPISYLGGDIWSFGEYAWCHVDSLDIASVPEPRTFTMFALGLICLLWFRAKSKKISLEGSR